MKKIFLLSGIIGIMLVLFASSCTRMRFVRGDREERVDIIAGKMAREYDLDDDQEAVLTEVLNNIYLEILDNKQESQEKHELYLREIRSSNFNSEAILEYEKENEAIQYQNKEYMLEQFKRFHAVLTPEQREQLALKLEQTFDKWYEFIETEE
jgi:Spy/CpxP family protein refolding chaperone